MHAQVALVPNQNYINWRMWCTCFGHVCLSANMANPKHVLYCKTQVLSIIGGWSSTLFWSVHRCAHAQQLLTECRRASANRRELVACIDASANRPRGIHLHTVLCWTGFWSWTCCFSLPYEHYLFKSSHPTAYNFVNFLEMIGWRRFCTRS